MLRRYTAYADSATLDAFAHDAAMLFCCRCRYASAPLY